MLEIECTECKNRYWVEGYTTPDGLMEPGEVVIADESHPDPLWQEVCEHLKDGAEYEVTDESHERFDDDVI